jgi:hypothetical protein
MSKPSGLTRCRYHAVFVVSESIDYIEDCCADG